MAQTASFQSQIKTAPRPYDPDRARDVRTAFADQPGDVLALLAGTAGCSPYLADLMQREADWLREALLHPPEAAMAGLLTQPASDKLDTAGAGLRQKKRRAALLTALADLGGVWDLAAVTGALSDLADHAVGQGLRLLLAEELRRDRLPGADESALEDAAGMVVLAMGKLGARELNYSSDIDLICLYDEQRYPGVTEEARMVFIRVTRKLAALLSDVTDQGYVFRTDLRLRPDASVTPVCLSMAAAEAYYESEGRTWERAAYIKARVSGGDAVAGARFLRTLAPFVWRKHLDFAAIQDAHDMRLRIRDHRQLHGRIKVEGHDLKLGQGGIREIEFFTQTRQLISGGRDPSLRDPTTMGGLAALAAKGWVPDDAARALGRHYVSHRTLEHRLQMVADAQTHALPGTPEGVARIAAFCDQDEAVFRKDLLDRLHEVAALTEMFFAGGKATAAVVADGPDFSAADRDLVEGWSRYPALRTDRAQALFARMRPRLLQRLNRAANPGEALVALDGFLAGLPAGVQIFALFDANPSLLDLIVDIAATAPALARYLSRNASVLDGVIGGSFFGPWPGPKELAEGLSVQMRGAKDYESHLDAARRWLKEWHFRVGVHHLQGLISADEAGGQYADLADAVLAGIWPVVVAAFEVKHGPLPGNGAVVLGMGSLGARLLNAGSDLDLIVIYDPADSEGSTGPRPLGTRAYYARLTQALVTALAAPMAEGRLYEVDMRLRPSGRQGPVATSITSFRDYQENEAWTWEHLALTRARVVAGAPALGAEIEMFRRDLIARKGKGAGVVGDVRDMRDRLRAARPDSAGLEPKFGPGRLLEIALFAQMTALRVGSPERGLIGQLAAGTGLFLSETDAQMVLAAAQLEWQLQAGLRLLEADGAAAEGIGQGAMAFLMRETGAASLETLLARQAEVTRACDAVIAAHLDAGQ